MIDINKLQHNKVYWFLSAVIIIGLLVAVPWLNSHRQAKKYSIIYLSSGEIYVGHLYTFPKLELQGAYILQNIKTANDKTDIQLFPLAETVWSPTTLYINKQHVIYYGPLSEDSTAFKAIKSKLQK